MACTRNLDLFFVFIFRCRCKTKSKIWTPIFQFSLIMENEKWTRLLKSFGNRPHRKGWIFHEEENCYTGQLGALQTDRPRYIGWNSPSFDFAPMSVGYITHLPKCPLSWDIHAPLHRSDIPRAPRLHAPNGIMIGSAVFARLTVAISRSTDRHADRLRSAKTFVRKCRIYAMHAII